MNHLLYSAVARTLPLVLQTKNKQRVCILTYHRVLPERDYMRSSEPTVATFDWHMELLARYFNPLSLSDAIARLDNNDLPERAVCVTFDDGYANNAECALPVLQRWSIPATVFISTGFLNGGLMWNDAVIEALRIAESDEFDLRSLGLATYDLADFHHRRQAAGQIIREIKHWPPEKRAEAIRVIECMVGPLPENMMLTNDQVKQLSDAGIEIGAHTRTHPILAMLKLADARQEIQASKNALETLVDKPVRYFAYPNGRPEIDYRLEHRDFVKSIGFEGAVSTQWGVVSGSSDRWQMPRFTPWDQTPLRFMVRLLAMFRNPA
ncbi:polysaccharide deacetylase family protein [Porticoccus hydrocarbonoclasticus]|uniref:polysaccharide deacetylase family protein n=1 Tax=Porticoccus hydrocarbonoclasticus TaxID=1073414 RepID=UPI0009DDB575|nr:polysaccharide deacetylase family protein [Porticoccus hydrocarbonoclasticus]